jgi:hypothetical protein
MFRLRGKACAKASANSWNMSAFRIGELQEEPLACRRLHGAIDIEPLEDVLDRPHRLHAASGEAPAANGQ